MELDGKVNERKQDGWKWNFTMHIIQFNFIINIQSVLLPQKINIHAQKMEVNLEGKSGGWKKNVVAFCIFFFSFTTAVAYVSTFHAHSLSFTPYVLWLCCYFMMAIKHFFYSVPYFFYYAECKLTICTWWEKIFPFSRAMSSCNNFFSFHSFLFLLPIFWDGHNNENYNVMSELNTFSGLWEEKRTNWENWQ